MVATCYQLFYYSLKVVMSLLGNLKKCARESRVSVYGYP